jgi:TatD DNase family protein
MARWIDDHCHLDLDPVRAAAEVAAAAEAGVERLISVGCDVDQSAAYVDAARRHDGIVFATAGVHPHDASRGIGGLEALLHEPEIVAVGECGLDFHYDRSPRDVQREVFAAQVALAHAHDLPLVIHTREAWPETFEVLDAEGMPERTVFHCFTGGPDEARRCLDRGAVLSFSGIVTFPSATDLQDAARQCPLDRLLVETDSPYLAPAPYRGKRNEPAYVVRVVDVVAEARGMPSAEVGEIVSANFKRLFRP